LPVVRAVVVFACMIPIVVMVVMVLAIVMMVGVVMVRPVIRRRQNDHRRWYTIGVDGDRGGYRMRCDWVGFDGLFSARRLNGDRLLIAVMSLLRFDGQFVLVGLNALGGFTFTVFALALSAVAGIGGPHNRGRPCAVGTGDVGKDQLSIRA